MLISAFTFACNADKLYYPVKESVTSVLPVAGEVIVALGESDADDKTAEKIHSIDTKKLKIFNRTWNPALFANSRIFAHETDFGLSQCTGTWCLHIQADEVIHEDDLDAILQACKKYEHDLEVDGMLFDFKHFWGDYEHLVETHGLHRREIRIVRNGIGAYSYKDSISFRKGNDQKLRVVKIPARIFHYGYLRPPELMSTKTKVHNAIHHSNNLHKIKTGEQVYNWGPLGSLARFNGTHPQVMTEWIKKFNWAESLNYRKPALYERSNHTHLKPKYRFMTWLEKNFNNNNEIFGFKNYKLLNK